MADEKLIFPIGFDLEKGVKEASKEWKSTYQKQLQKAIDEKPLKVKIELQTKGLDLEALKELNKHFKEAVKVSQANAKIQKANIQVTERQLLADERVAAAHERTLAATNRRLVAEEKLTQAKQRSTRATNEQNEAYKTQGGYLSRLFQRMVAYASVTQAFSFIRNIREVTAQFELQRVALGSIIGDLNEANAMFEQIKAAAVKSPFQIKELVTYTKNLAAYKIESDELFETTQKLADISAGLGVGMERLVLAYGQIRATGYLRASEVRQLTEAGIPIVEELAKKMSELRDETVSAAEVMGMISERAISFGMVKEVFDDMTSAGGMFYKMQEKQAETLAGQWSNLKDSIAIMYEEIGNTETAQNGIKGMIGLVKSLAENWRTVGTVASWSFGFALVYAKILKPLGAMIEKQRQLNMAFDAYHKARLAYGNYQRTGIESFRQETEAQVRLARAYRKSAKALSGFGGALKSIGSFIKGNWIGILLTGVVALASWLASARQEANRLNKELAKIDTEGALQADQSVRNFERLAKAIRESANGSAKQTEALEEMKRAYGEFLPSQDKSIINLVREKDGYNAVTQAIREKIALQIQEQKLNTVTSEYGGILGDYQGKVRENLEKDGWHRDIISAIFRAIENEVKEGTLDISNVAQKLPEIFEQITGESLNYLQILTKSGSNFWGTSYLLEYIRNLNIYEDKLKDIISESEESVGVFGKYTQAFKDFKEELKDVTGTGEKFSFEWNESKTKAEIKAYNEFVGDLLAKEGIKFDIGEAIDFKGLYEALGDNYPQLKQVVAKIQGEYEKLVPKDLEKLIKEQFSTLATKYGASLDKLQHYFKSADQSTQDWVKTLKDAKTELGNQIFDAKKLDKDTTALEAQKQVIEEMITAWDNSEKTQKAGAKSAEQALKDELSAVEKIYKRYQDLRKLKSETDTQSILAKEFKGVSLTTLSKAYSPEQMIEVYQKALAEAQRLGKKDLVSEIQTKIGEFNVAEEQRKLEKKLKDLSDQISRTKTAKEFFDRMLGMTGDKQLSATLTLSVYGTTGDDLKSALVKQVEQAFKGVDGDIDVSDAIDYNTMTINYQKLAEIYAKNQDRILDETKSMAESIVKNGQKTSASQIEQWAKELEAVKTYADKRVDIARQTQQRISEIEASTLPEDEKQRLQEQYRKKEEKDLAKLEYQSFKESPMYVAMFDNLDSASTAMLNNMRAKLMELKEAWGGLDMPTELKEMQSRLNEIDKQLASRNPFKTLANAYKGYQDLREQGSRKDAEQDLIDKTARHAKEVAILNENIKEATRYQQAYDDAVAEYGKDSVQARTAEAQLYIANSVVETQKDSVNTTEDAVEASQELVNKWKELDDVVGGAWEQADMLTQAIINLGRNLADAFGGFGSEADAEYFDTMMDSFSNLSSGITSIGKGIATGNPISIINGIGSAISGLAGLFTAGKVRKANKEIERQQELIDRLSKSYDKLKEKADSAYGSEFFSNIEARNANLQAQIEAYEKQIEAERSKGKKADADKIKDIQESIDEANEAIAESTKELSERLLGTDLGSAAREFANAWLDAYDEFGNTAEAIEGKFRELIRNMIVEAVLGAVMKKALKPVFDMIENMDSSDIYDPQFWKDFANVVDKSSKDANTGANNAMQAMENLGAYSRNMTSGLTGISKDIASASEESILGLAAGINTQNFYISQVPPKLDIIIALLQGGGVQVGGGVNMQDLITIQNQHLSHLPNIAQNTAETVAECKMIVAETRRTADALERVIKPRGTQATHTVNTSL